MVPTSNCGSTPEELPSSTADLNEIKIALRPHHQANAWFRDHQMNTQPPPNEQAGTGVWEQRSVTPDIDSLLNNQGTFHYVEYKSE
jgi:hypothetical protein